MLCKVIENINIKQRLTLPAPLLLFLEEKSSNNSLYKVGLLSMIAIILHNIHEDCICHVSY